MSRNNTSGRTGVMYRKGINGRSDSYVAQVGHGKNRKTKSFAINKFGEKEAFRLACEQRELWEKEFDILTEKRSTTIENTVNGERP